MVTKILSGTSISGMLRYNENKVTSREASLLMASGFATDVAEMTFGQKLQRFKHLTILNRKTKTNAIHISVNFDNQDKKMNDNTLRQIANNYMEKIGFGDQPYLIYKHFDAAHPHLHIATTNIKADGKRIDTHDIGKTLSESARKELEIDFNLIKAEGRKASDNLSITKADPEKAVYGKVPTKGTITNIVNAVISNYKFTSLAEFNAILQQFNVTADRGAEDTIMYEKNGLIYSIIKNNGEHVGIPIKASNIYKEPTLKNLAPTFLKNLQSRKELKPDLKARLDTILNKYQGITKETLNIELGKEKINLLYRENKQGLTYGITFIDNKNQVVFNGSDIGKDYRLSSILLKLAKLDIIKPEFKTYLNPVVSANYLKRVQEMKPYFKPINRSTLKSGEPKILLKESQPLDIFKGFLNASTPNDTSPMSRKKRKRKKGQGHDQEQSL